MQLTQERRVVCLSNHKLALIFPVTEPAERVSLNLGENSTWSWLTHQAEVTILASQAWLRHTQALPACIMLSWGTAISQKCSFRLCLGGQCQSQRDSAANIQNYINRIEYYRQNSGPSADQVFKHAIQCHKFNSHENSELSSQ